MTNEKRQDVRLLERLAREGKQTSLLDEDLALAMELQTLGYVFLVGSYAVITPRGRRLLAELAQPSTPTKKPPLGFLEP
jgi:hypothetical protein